MESHELEALRAALADRYDLERVLGRGGMATVYLATDRKHRRAVAIKVLRPDFATALGAERFLKEIETVAGLTHPHILPLHDSGFAEIAGESETRPYYVMPYVAGETLRDRLRREGQLPVDDALRIARNVADALAYAHSHGVVHRDVKPANILLSGGHAVVADFGIARAISAALEESGTGAAGEGTAEAGRAREVTVLGTPAYMSPEQCFGSSRVDGRSDIYSLGCVLYEMLAGRPPFEGDTISEVGAQHVADPPPPLSASGRAIPAELEQVVYRALAKMPADRYATALQFAEALPEPTGRSSGPRAAQANGTARRRARPWALVAAAGALVLAAIAFVVAPRLGPFGAVDRSLYVVLPFGHRGPGVPDLLNGNNCESLLYEGFARWSDLRLVNLLRVHDAKARAGNGPITFERGLAIARQLGAGTLAWGEIWELRDTIHVHAALYDVARKGAVVREATIKLPKATPDLGRAFDALADSLLTGGSRAPLAATGAAGTGLLDAWRSYAAGHEALMRWDLPAAESAFERATRLDPTYAQAQLWLAQVTSWQGKPAAEYRAAAAAALEAPGRLTPHDAAVARGLLAMAQGQWARACDEFDGLIAHDSLDFTAWYGRGDCLAGDKLVVRDAKSPSGWRFRSSYHAAIGAYQRALEALPSVHAAFAGRAFERLQRMLFAESSRIRGGYALAPDTVRYAAYPALSADTLAFVPYPIMALLNGQTNQDRAPILAAVDQGRTILAGVTAQWARAFPTNPDAVEGNGVALELRGRLASPTRAEPSALESYRQARRLATSPQQRLRLAVGEVRVLVKLQQFDAARMLADSILATTDAEQGGAPAYLAGLATLTGRVHLTAALLRRSVAEYDGFTSDGRPVPLPPALAEGALGLLAYASVGAPEDSIRVIRQRLARQLELTVPPQEREPVTYAALNGPLMVAFPVGGRSQLHQSDSPAFQLRLQDAAFRGDTAAVRAGLALIHAAQAQVRPGQRALDGVYHDAVLALMIGDTAQAVNHLDRALGGFQNLNLDLLGSSPMFASPQAGALVRVMVLRARLAAISGDSATARRWAHDVLSLWARADAPLQGVLAQMRALGG